MCNKGYSSADLEAHITGKYAQFQDEFDEEEEVPDILARKKCACGQPVYAENLCTNCYYHKTHQPEQPTDHPAPDTEQS